MFGIQRREWFGRLKYGGLTALILFISIFAIKGKKHKTQFQIIKCRLQLLIKINFRFSMINVISYTSQLFYKTRICRTRKLI